MHNLTRICLLWLALLSALFVAGCSHPAAVQGPPPPGSPATGNVANAGTAPGAMSPDQARTQFLAGQAADPTPAPGSK